MVDQMTKWERVTAALRGEPTDRLTWSLWRHFYERETSPEGLAEAMLDFQQTYDVDFMKVNPRASYHVEDWGVQLEFSGQPHVRPRIVSTPIQEPDDWEQLRILPPDRGVLGEHLRALRLIGEGLRGEVPFIQTIFTPLSLAGDLVPDDATLVRHMNERPEAVHTALEIISETFAHYARACVDAGAAGLFFATTSWASRDTIQEADYEKFGRPYDLKVLEAVADSPLNVLHVCGSQNMLLSMGDYPVAAFNWAATDPTNPSLAEAAEVLDPALVGGISRDALTAETTDAVLGEARMARDQAAGRRWILGPNCSIPTNSRPENILALKEFLTSS